MSLKHQHATRSKGPPLVVSQDEVSDEEVQESGKERASVSFASPVHTSNSSAHALEEASPSDDMHSMFLQLGRTLTSAIHSGFADLRQASMTAPNASSTATLSAPPPSSRNVESAPSRANASTNVTRPSPFDIFNSWQESNAGESSNATSRPSQPFISLDNSNVSAALSILLGTGQYCDGICSGMWPYTTFAEGTKVFSRTKNELVFDYDESESSEVQVRLEGDKVGHKYMGELAYMSKHQLSAYSAGITPMTLAQLFQRNHNMIDAACQYFNNSSHSDLLAKDHLRLINSVITKSFSYVSHLHNAQPHKEGSEKASTHAAAAILFEAKTTGLLRGAYQKALKQNPKSNFLDFLLDHPTLSPQRDLPLYQDQQALTKAFAKKVLSRGDFAAIKDAIPSLSRSKNEDVSKLKSRTTALEKQCRELRDTINAFKSQVKKALQDAGVDASPLVSKTKPRKSKPASASKKDSVVGNNDNGG